MTHDEFILLRHHLEQIGEKIVHNVAIMTGDGELENLLIKVHAMQRANIQFRITTAFGVLELKQVSSFTIPADSLAPSTPSSNTPSTSA